MFNKKQDEFSPSALALIEAVVASTYIHWTFRTHYIVDNHYDVLTFDSPGIRIEVTRIRNKYFDIHVNNILIFRERASSDVRGLISWYTNTADLLKCRDVQNAIDALKERNVVTMGMLYEEI